MKSTTRALSKRYGSRGTVDKEMAEELELYIYNESTLYNQRKSIIDNLARKMSKGTYDSTKAVKLWRYWVDNGARRYAKEFNMIDGIKAFNVPTRDEVAKSVERQERDDIARLVTPQKSTDW